MILYIITNRANGKIYIGITSRGIEKRFAEHWTNSRSPLMKATPRYFYRALRKYRRELWSIAELGRASSWEELQKMEIDAIASYRSNDREVGYNSTIGGGGVVGYIMSDETKKKLSAAHTGRKLSESTKEKLRALHRDPVWSENATSGIRFYKKTPEQLKLMSEKAKGRRHSPESRAKMSASTKGIRKSPEHIAKSVASRLAMKFKKTPEQKEKSARFHRGRTRPPETGRRISESLKALYSTRPKRSSPKRNPERDAEIMAHYYHSQNMRITGLEFGIKSAAVHTALDRCRREYEQRLQAASRLYSDHVAPRVIPPDFLGYAFGGFR